MFSLIITIISIALVAALALATLYYGADAFSQGRVKAEAAKIRVQGQQIQAAADLFRFRMGRYPNQVAELVSADYLKSIPVAQAAALQSALAADMPWVMPLAATPVFMLTEVDEQVCAEVNQQTGASTATVEQTLSPDLLMQCYGVAADTRAFRVVLAKSTSALADAVADPVSNELLNPDGAGGGAPGGGGPGALLLGIASTYFGGPVSGTNVLSGNAASGYQLSFGDPATFFVTVTNSGTEVLTPTILGSNLDPVYFMTADDMVTHWGAATAQEAQSWYDGAEFPLCLRNESLDPGESCVVEAHLETAPAYPTLTLDGAVVQVVPGASFGVSPSHGWPNGYEVRFASGPDRTQDYTIQNTGGGPLTGLTLTTVGSSSYSVSHNCPSTLQLGASCQATLAFDAASAGHFNASLVLDTDQTSPRTLNFSVDAVDAEVVFATTLTPGTGAMTLSMAAVSGSLPALMDNQDLTGPGLTMSVSPGTAEGGQPVDQYVTWNAPYISGQTYSWTIPALCGGAYGPCLGNAGGDANTGVSWRGATPEGGSTLLAFTLADAETAVPSNWCVAASPVGAFGFADRVIVTRRGPC